MTPEIRRQLGAERARVRHLIAHEMRLRGKTAASLARDLGCTGENVRRALNGTTHSPLVLDALLELGVSRDLLFDPRVAETAGQ